MRTRRWRLAMAATLSAALTMALLLILGSDSAQVSRASGQDSYATYYVAPGGGCGGIAPCFDTVQGAVDAADDPSDVIKVAAGTYVGVESRPAPLGYFGSGVITQVVCITKGLTIQGGYVTGNWTVPDPDANQTTLDAEGQGRVVAIAGNITITLQGLRLTNGDATGLGGSFFGDAGGGVYVSTAGVTIGDCAIYCSTTGPSDGWGGGAFVQGVAAVLEDSLLVENTSSLYGGGIALAGAGGRY